MYSDYEYCQCHRNPITPGSLTISRQMKRLRRHLGLTEAEFGWLLARAVQGKRRGAMPQRPGWKRQRPGKEYWGSLALAPATYVKRWESGLLPGKNADYFTPLDILWALKRIAKAHNFPFTIKTSWLDAANIDYSDNDVQGAYYEPETPIYRLPLPPEKYVTRGHGVPRRKPKIRFYPPNEE